jgi:ornithine carbamoyltransferase
VVLTRRFFGRDFINTSDWTDEELETVLELAGDLKRRFSCGESHELLRGKTLFMMFYAPSTRTRNSFEAGMTQLGGHAHYLSPQATWVNDEGVKDTALTLSRYGHAISVRYYSLLTEPYGKSHQTVLNYAKWASIPVINMEDGMYHPCQGMADLMTIREKFNDLEGKRFAFCWSYDDSRQPLKDLGSELNTSMELMTRSGMDVIVALPPGFEADKNVVEVSRKNAEHLGTEFKVVNSLEEACEGADVVYTKNSVAWNVLLPELRRDPKSGVEREYEYEAKHKDWRITDRLMDMTAKNSLFMHCLPAARNKEVDDSVLDGAKSVVYDEAENRLHVQKAIMALVMGGLS